MPDLSLLACARQGGNGASAAPKAGAALGDESEAAFSAAWAANAPNKNRRKQRRVMA
ncbi:MAG: hypothetical protein ACLQO1_05480 [Steroidobacteraceae bacterium]